MAIGPIHLVVAAGAAFLLYKATRKPTPAQASTESDGGEGLDPGNPPLGEGPGTVWPGPGGSPTEFAPQTLALAWSPYAATRATAAAQKIYSGWAPASKGNMTSTKHGMQKHINLTRQTVQELWPTAPWPETLAEMDPNPNSSTPKWVDSAGAIGPTMLAIWNGVYAIAQTIA